MAPLPVIYFPSLDACLLGIAEVISWQSIFLRLRKSDASLTGSDNVFSFLICPESIRILSSPFDPYPKPSEKSKSSFDSGTAAINVTSGPQDRCNFDEIKGDALWLSEKTSIDEVSALRIAILEWQQRAENDLLYTFSDEEVSSLQDVFGEEQVSRPVGGFQAFDVFRNTSQKEPSSKSLTEDERRLKLYHIYLLERQYIIKVALSVLSLSLRGILPGAQRYCGQVKESRLTQRGTKLDELGASVFPRQNNNDINVSGIAIQACIEAIQLRLGDMERARGWLSKEDEYHRQMSLTREIADIMQILFLRVQETENIPSGKLLLSWMHIVVKYDFFDQNRPLSDEELLLFNSLQLLTAIITLSFLKLRKAVTLLATASSQPSRASQVWGDNHPSFLSRNEVGELNEMFLKAAESAKLGASPAVFAWSVIMFFVRDIATATREERELQQAQHAVDSFNGDLSSASSSRNTEPSIYEDAYERARNPAFDDDFVRFMMIVVLEKCHIFDVASNIIRQLDGISGVGGSLVSQWARIEILDLIRASTGFFNYIPELLFAVLQVTKASGSNSSCLEESAFQAHNGIQEIFLHDDILMSKIFGVAKSRFPYEASNFLKLCRSLLDCDLSTQDGHPLILQELESMSTYTQVVSPGFQGYRSTREDENANYVLLTESLEMGEVSSTKRDNGNRSGSALVVSEASRLPADTLGQVVNESKPAIIMWHHQYNCLNFLGMWLEQGTRNGATECEPDDEVMANIIGLLADLLNSAQTISKREGTESCARRILEMASDGLNHHGDIISVIFDIFDRNLQTATGKTGSDRGLELITACLSFLNALITVIPGRVWPFLTRSCLIAGDGNGGSLATIISAIEVNTGDFTFLLEAVRTLQLIVADAAKHLVVRKTAGKVTARATHLADYTAGTPLHAMGNLLLSFVRIMADIYNSSANWRYNDLCQSLTLNVSLTNTFNDILQYTYGIGNTKDLNSNLTGVFAPSAQCILNILRPAPGGGIFFNPVVRLILSSYQYPVLAENVLEGRLQSQLVGSALRLASTLTQAGWVPHSPLTGLEKRLFDISPLLVRIYVLRQTHRTAVVNLLELLVTHAAMDKEHEPPSLLGHLGPQSSCRFLDVLSKFDRPFNDPDLNSAVWKLLTTIISKRQQWLAVFLLTGSSPRTTLKKDDGKQPSMISKPFLQTALHLVSSIDKIPSQLALSALQFIAKTQENWPWATPQLKNHAAFFPKLTDYISGLDMRQYSAFEQCMKTKLASVVADICAVYLHTAKEQRDWAFFKTLIPLITWYSENAVNVDGYNASLHANLKRNFEMKYPGCSLLAFKKTVLRDPTFGDGYFYDIELATELLGYDFGWIGSRNQGFQDEIKRANENLSLVQAQMDLLDSFKFLAIEHCVDFMTDHGVQKSMAFVVRSCLTANLQCIPNEKIFCALHQIRAEFALGLLQRLVESNARGHEVFALLETAWDTTRSRCATYEAALANNDVEYYGLLLNVLFLALQFHIAGNAPEVAETVSKRPKVSGHLETILDIVKVIVAQGFRSLTTFLHEEPQKCSPKDFALLTAILQTALKAKSIDRIYEQITFHLINCDAIRYACTLFSWSYKLTVEGDPVYGELSILYLLELSCIPTMAEQMAVDGILVKLSTYRLTDVLRQPNGCGPFDQVPRLFAIWHTGFLPLCLNMLYHVGRSASEVAVFLNQFEGQLRRASEAFSVGHPTSTTSPLSRNHLSPSHSNKRISLGMATEACSLALISLIIDKFRSAGPSAGVDPDRLQELKWDRARVKEDIEVLLEKRQVLRSWLTPTSEREVSWSQQRPSKSDLNAESLLEEKIVKELRVAVSCIDDAGRE